MKSWHKITAFLCIYGIFKEIRPSEPYLTEYLEGPWINLTSSQVDHEVYPIWTYSYLVFLFVVLLITDFLRYKPILIIEGLAYIGTWSLLLFSRSLISMQIMQALYGIATATEVAYYTYIYSIVSKDEFQKVTSFTRASLLFGRCISGITSQVLISTNIMDFHSLNYVSFASIIVAFLIALSLPQPVRGIHQKHLHTLSKHMGCCGIEVKEFWRFIVYELKKCYSNRDLLLWSLWWAFATSGNIQVGNYVQPLWETIEPTWGSVNNTVSNNTSTYNGAVEAAHTLLGSMAAMGLSLTHIHFIKYTETLLGALSLIDCLLLLAMAMTTEIWIAYISYIAFRTTYQMMITIVSYNVVKLLDLDTYGLIFGVNTFFALVIQTLMTVIIVDKNGLHLDTKTQFVTYSVYFGFLAMLFVVIGLYKCYQRGCFPQCEHVNHYPLEESIYDNSIEQAENNKQEKDDRCDIKAVDTIFIVEE